MYVFISDRNIVRELIMDVPGISMEERYPISFLQFVRLVPKGVEVEEGYIFDPQTESFSKPPIIPPEPAKPDNTTPITEDKPETYQEMVLRLNNENGILRGQLAEAIHANQMLEECVIEMANIIYA